MTYDRILLDVESQRDIFLPKGSLYCPQAAKAAPQIYKLFKWARQQQVPVVSTVLRQLPSRPGAMGEPPHLIEGTDGEKKLPRTLLTPNIDLGLRNDTDLPLDLFDRYRQVIFEKRQTDIFRHAKAERMITELTGVTFVVCGGGVAQGIVEAAVGLRNRGFGVILAEDAVVDFGHADAEMAYLRMRAKGVVFAQTAEITQPRARLRPAPFRQNSEAVR